MKLDIDGKIMVVAKIEREEHGRRMTYFHVGGRGSRVRRVREPDALVNACCLVFGRAYAAGSA
jgi:hypothetical protein